MKKISLSIRQIDYFDKQKYPLLFNFRRVNTLAGKQVVICSAGLRIRSNKKKW
jgi:hypothetical protein